MTKYELSLLLYFENCAVDYGGRVNALRMNADDMAIAARWRKESFVSFGRIIIKDHNRDGTHWVELSEEAWAAAHAERRARARRMAEARSYTRTKEKAVHA